LALPLQQQAVLPDYNFFYKSLQKIQHIHI
jgi:hypothetical protein